LGVAKLPPAPDHVNEGPARRPRKKEPKRAMTDFRHVTDDISVSPQIRPADVAEAAKQGFKLIINNRPDGEEPGQPTAAEIEAAAKAAGLAYVHVPVRGGPTPQQVEEVRQAIASPDGPTLAYFRSRTRSLVT